jgi:predicted lipoprotein with Yx(FWY)xxD motif
MKRTSIFLASILAGCASYAAVASAQGGDVSAHAGRAASVQLRHTSLGSILTSASGLTLYDFTRDHGDHNSCVTVKGCATVWPALQTSGAPSAGRGVRASLLSTIALAGGVKQVTYAGHPLYLFKGDEPGDTAYVGIEQFGGAWDALNAAGNGVK